MMFYFFDLKYDFKYTFVRFLFTKLLSTDNYHIF